MRFVLYSYALASFVLKLKSFTSEQDFLNGPLWALFKDFTSLRSLTIHLRCTTQNPPKEFCHPLVARELATRILNFRELEVCIPKSDSSKEFISKVYTVSRRIGALVEVSTSTDDCWRSHVDW